MGHTSGIVLELRTFCQDSLQLKKNLETVSWFEARSVRQKGVRQEVSSTNTHSHTQHNTRGIMSILHFFRSGEKTRAAFLCSMWTRKHGICQILSAGRIAELACTKHTTSNVRSCGIRPRFVQHISSTATAKTVMAADATQRR